MCVCEAVLLLKKRWISQIIRVGSILNFLKILQMIGANVFFNFLDTAGGRDRGQNEFMAVADSNFTIIADIKIGKQTSVINWVYK